MVSTYFLTLLGMVFAPESVKPLNLPSLPLTWRKAFPDCPCVYFAILGKKILYIGRSYSLNKRWSNHHRCTELEEAGDVRIAWIQVSEAELLPLIEAALIKYFKPLLNRTGVKVSKQPSGRNRGNPNFTFRIKPKGEKPLAKRMIGVRLPEELDKYVRSLPNRTEWLRKAIARQVEEDLKETG